jgi:ferredoxin-NADP reductase
VLTAERLEAGEVSSYLVDALHAGDELELRGPLGAHFVWEESMPGPLFLVAEGIGLAPFRAMLRHHRAVRSSVPVRLLYSARSLPHLLYRDELMQIATRDNIDVSVTFTSRQPKGWHGYGRRIDDHLLVDVGWPPDERPLVYVCGRTPFVENAANALLALVHDSRRIRTERFGGL